MTEETQVTIEAIDEKSPHLQTVIALGDANKATLGFFPKRAFLEHSARRQIIVAFSPQRECLGYLLYGIARSYNRITLTHLCISPSHKGKGITKKLVTYLKDITKEYSGIGLTCRRDYKLENMWSKLGFVAQHDKSARTLGKELTYWWLDYGKPNLFSVGINQQLESKLCVVIDAKIFFDLSQPESIDYQESQSLLADWLKPEISLCLTEEIFNKINELSSSLARKRQQNYAKTFTYLPCLNKIIETIYGRIKAFFRQNVSICNESDLRYLARTIAADAQIFVTREPLLLQLADEIYKTFRLSVITPTELINRLDDLRRNTEYQPVRLAGTLLKQIRVQGGQESFFNDYFQSEDQGETKAKFQQKLRRFLAETDKFECSVVFEGENQPLALVVYDRHKQHELEIPMFRITKNSLAATIAHHLLFQIASLSAREKRQFTRINDPHLQEVVITAIQKDTFVKVNDGWLRANIAVAETASHLSKYLTDLVTTLGDEYNFCRQISQSMNTDSAHTDIKAMWDIERYIFPAKIIDADIPTFIVPIKPFWAHQLFDAKLANQTIIGATKTELALNREAVYYKSKKAPKQLQPGVNGRILWYVSADKYSNRGYTEVSAVRACSRLDEVFIGKPKDLYRRFRDLGIYEEKNLLDVANNNLEKEIMALRFSDTELFNEPIPLVKIQEVLGNQTTIPTTTYIYANNFARIYTLGTQT
jgi:GNAT superfamily N-acetyltransferase/predicted nucleic acid-binding protein